MLNYCECVMLYLNIRDSEEPTKSMAETYSAYQLDSIYDFRRQLCLPFRTQILIGSQEGQGWPSLHSFYPVRESLGSYNLFFPYTRSVIEFPLKVICTNTELGVREDEINKWCACCLFGSLCHNRQTQDHRVQGNDKKGDESHPYLQPVVGQVSSLQCENEMSSCLEIC